MVDSAIVTDILANLAVPLGRWHIPVLIGFFGLPGTGKTETAHRLAARFPLVVLSTDAVRLRYQLSSGPATHNVMYDVASTLLPMKVGLLVDGIHLGRPDRLRLRQCADRHQARSALIYTTARSAVVEERLEARRCNEQQTTAAGKFVITPEHFARIASYLEAPTADEAVWQIDTSGDGLDRQLAPLERWLGDLLQVPNQ